MGRDPRRDVPRPASEIRDRASLFRLFDETRKKRSVEWLVSEFAGEMRRVLLGYCVVAATHAFVVGLVSHDGSFARAAPRAPSRTAPVSRLISMRSHAWPSGADVVGRGYRGSRSERSRRLLFEVARLARGSRRRRSRDREAAPGFRLHGVSTR